MGRGGGLGGIGFGCRNRGDVVVCFGEGEMVDVLNSNGDDPIVVQHTDEGFGVHRMRRDAGGEDGEGQVEIMQVVDCSDGLVPAFTRWTVPSGITRWMVESAASSSPVHVSISRGGGHLGTSG